MRFYLISDNSDAMNGLRLAGIEGTVARSEADLRAAQKEPDKYRDLVVRVAGYSSYFTVLTPRVQDEIIMRNEQAL